MFERKYKNWALLSLLATGSIFADPTIGVVDFTACATNSKVGQFEQSNFENMKKQLGSHLEKTEKELNELATKLNDADYMDGLSPEAENELKEKIQVLNEELSRYHNQYYQVLNQANMKVVQVLSGKINAAAGEVAKDKKLDFVLHKDACFFHTPTLDVTDLVVAKMDVSYDKESKAAAKEAPKAN